MNAEEAAYTPGNLESSKFQSLKPKYYEGLRKIFQLGYSSEDLLHHFPAFTGSLTLARYLAIYELYRKTLGVSGHIAEIGVYKGACSLLLAKLTQIFEPRSLVQVHGFDWFKGTVPTLEEPNVREGSYAESEERLRNLISAQELDSIVKVHNLDVTTDLPDFFGRHTHLQFKLVFLDAGLYSVVKEAVLHFWPRLNRGGVLILDQYNFDLAPGETRAIQEFLPDAKIETFPWTWLPSAYIVKP